MDKPSALKEKSFQFSIQVMAMNKKLKEAKTDHIISRQLLRAGTAVGAMISESEFAQSKADFISKLSIALKEANESEYWMKLVMADQPELGLGFSNTRELLSEIIRMLVASIKTAKGQR